jgi:hypothetical protein
MSQTFCCSSRDRAGARSCAPWNSGCRVAGRSQITESTRVDWLGDEDSNLDWRSWEAACLQRIQSGSNLEESSARDIEGGNTKPGKRYSDDVLRLGAGHGAAS